MFTQLVQTFKTITHRTARKVAPVTVPMIGQIVTDGALIGIVIAHDGGLIAVAHGYGIDFVLPAVARVVADSVFTVTDIPACAAKRGALVYDGALVGVAFDSELFGQSVIWQTGEIVALEEAQGWELK